MKDHSYSQFREHYNQYVKKIYSYLYYRSGRDRDLAEDLTSEVFIKALEKFPTFNPKESAFGAWIYAIARNHLIDHYRLKKPTVSLEDVQESRLSVNPDLAQQIDSSDKLSNVVEVINSLPENYREILTMKYLNGFENREIGDILGKSQTNVRVLLHRAHNALQKKLDQPIE